MVENIVEPDKLCHSLVVIFVCMKVDGFLAIEKDNVQNKITQEVLINESPSGFSEGLAVTFYWLLFALFCQHCL